MQAPTPLKESAIPGRGCDHHDLLRWCVSGMAVAQGRFGQQILLCLVDIPFSCVCTRTEIMDNGSSMCGCDTMQCRKCSRRFLEAEKDSGSLKEQSPGPKLRSTGRCRSTKTNSIMQTASLCRRLPCTWYRLSNPIFHAPNKPLSPGRSGGCRETPISEINSFVLDRREYVRGDEASSSEVPSPPNCQVSCLFLPFFLSCVSAVSSCLLNSVQTCSDDRRSHQQVASSS